MYPNMLKCIPLFHEYTYNLLLNTAPSSPASPS